MKSEKRTLMTGSSERFQVELLCENPTSQDLLQVDVIDALISHQRIFPVLDLCS
jgi:hypothetical protein